MVSVNHLKLTYFVVNLSTKTRNFRSNTIKLTSGSAVNDDSDFKEATASNTSRLQITIFSSIRVCFTEYYPVKWSRCQTRGYILDTKSWALRILLLAMWEYLVHRYSLSLREHIVAHIRAFKTDYQIYRIMSLILR